jgi:hypothetical protein
MMNNGLKEKLNRESLFIEGLPSRTRKPDDASLSAQENAFLFIGNLPTEYQEPTVYSGTTLNPDIYLKLIWYNFAAGVHSVEVNCKGNERFTVVWHDSEGSQKCTDGEISFDELQQLDIPNKIAKLPLDLPSKNRDIALG